MTASLEAAVRGIPAGSSILLPPTCGTPSGLPRLLAEQSGRLRGTHLYSGLLLGDYPFLQPPHAERLRYHTWHVGTPASEAARRGEISAHPVQASEVTRFIRDSGADDVVIVQVAPPDADGRCSLGVSGSYVQAASRTARHLILHVNRAMPHIPDGCTIDLGDADVVVHQDQPLVEYASSSAVSATARRIADLLAPLLGDGMTLQLGLGSIPEAVLRSLARSGRRDLSIWGMASDVVVDAAEAGILRRDGHPSVHTHDVLGSRRVFDWLDGNPRVRLVGYDVGVDPTAISKVPGFVAINSALEVDLSGNVNSEVLDGRLVSGVGGSLDFMAGARRSEGGMSVIALPSTARRGEISRIVPRLTAGHVSVPRTSTQLVVTEHGIVDLAPLDLEARAAALIELAAPQHRAHLRAASRR